MVEKDDRGKNSVRKLGLSPVQRDGVEYEFSVVMDVSENHTARASKDRTSLFDGWSDRIGRQTGRMLRDWLESGADVPASRKADAAEYQDDSVPALDEPPPESTPAAQSEREAINTAVPLRQPKQTVGAWLEQFAATLERCSDREQVEATCLSDEALKASRTLKGNARARLRMLMDTALARHSCAPSA